MRDTIYQKMQGAGAKIEHHESDMSVPYSETTKDIVSKYPDIKSTIFFDDKGEKWYAIPFAYDPFWDKVKEKMAKNYMLNPEVYEQHIDYTCNVLNCTSLAEDAAYEFNFYEEPTQDNDYPIPEELYDLAYEVEKILIKRGICQD